MTKLSKNTRQSPSTRVLVPLLVLLDPVGAGARLRAGAGASTAPAPELVAMPAKITAARSATFRFRHRRPHMRFQCKLDRRAFVTCKLRKRYSHLVAGGHTFKVRAIHGKKKSRTATFKWIIDRTPPPTPKITSGPVRLPHTTVSRTATFRFESETGAKFLCSLNSSAAARFTACANAKSYRRVRLGANTFYVKAKDAAGNMSGTARRLWRVEGGGSERPVHAAEPPLEHDAEHDAERAAGHDARRDLGHGAGAGLHDLRQRGRPALPRRPGAADRAHPPQPERRRRLRHRAHPSRRRRTRRRGAAATTSSSSRSTSRPRPRQPNAIVVPANGDVTLPAQGVAAPTIRLVDSGTDQTAACENETFSLTYSGSAHS